MRSVLDFFVLCTILVHLILGTILDLLVNVILGTIIDLPLLVTSKKMARTRARAHTHTQTHTVSALLV